MSPLFFLLFLLVLSIYGHLPPQPPLVDGVDVLTRSSSFTLPAPSESAGGCIYCTSCTVSHKQFPYAGWVWPKVEVVDGGGEDRSPKCLEFAALCSDALYRLFLRSHCAVTCGHCVPTGVILPTPPPLAPAPKQKRNGQRRRVLAPTKRKGIGENNTTTMSSTTTTTTVMLTTTETTTVATTKGEGNCHGDSTAEPSTTANSTTASTPTSTATTVESKGNVTLVSVAPGNVTSSSTVASGTEPSDCEDIGKNCPALKAGCADMGQREILGVFCRRTCGFC